MIGRAKLYVQYFFSKITWDQQEEDDEDFDIDTIPMPGSLHTETLE